MPIVNVTAPEQAERYEIHIGHGLLSHAAPLLAMCAGRRAMIVTDENVAPLYADALRGQLELAGAQVSLFVLPAGEGEGDIELTLPELEHYSGALGWVHVCKDVS